MCPVSMPKQPGESVVLPGLYSGLEISLSVSTLLASRVVSWKIRKNGGGNGRGEAREEDRRERGDGDGGSRGKQWAASARLLAISLHRERECVERESRGAVVSLARGKRKEEEEVEEEVSLSLFRGGRVEGRRRDEREVVYGEDRGEEGGRRSPATPARA